MYDPSVRRAPLFVRTTTALTTSPFLTTPPGVACFTVQTITSPIPATLRPEPPRTLIVHTSRAPELSATFKRVFLLNHACNLLSELSLIRTY